MESAGRRGIRFFGLSLLAFLVPGLLGYIVANILGWSTVAQASIYGIGAYVFLIILMLLDTFERTSVTPVAWTLWAVAGVGIFAGVGCFVAADRTSGASVVFRIVGVVLIVVTSVVPITLRVGADRRSGPVEPAMEAASLEV